MVAALKSGGATSNWNIKTGRVVSFLSLEQIPIIAVSSLLNSVFSRMGENMEVIDVIGMCIIT